LGEKTGQPQSPSLGIESSLVVRLHFAEAIMVLMFNALSEPQQASIKQHFDDLLKRAVNVQVMGVQAETFQGYRDTLRAMKDMLASNPTPEAMATALAHDFAKRYSSTNDRGNAPIPPPSPG
jgi:Fe2+ transport system protein B